MPLIVRTRQILIVLILGLPALISAQVDFTSSNIPIVVINTDSQEIVDEYRIVAQMGIIHNEAGMRNHITDPFNDYSGKINIEIRGSTSQDFPKKSYGFETQDDSGEDRNVSLIDLPEENDWVLYAPFSDKTLSRNILAYRLFQELGQYAPRTKMCELVLNGEYQGVYVLIEKIKRDKNRVDIARLNPDEISGDDLSGGYILKIDKPTGNTGPIWQSDLGGINFRYEYPKYDEIVPEQKAYIKNYLDDFEQALMAVHYADPDNGYRKYMDENSFVDFFIINELAKNVDGYMLSTFIYKDKDSNNGKLCMGPIWDFNLAFGNANYRDAFLTHGLQYTINNVPWWWDRIIQDSTFTDHIQEKWCSIREKQFSDGAITSIIDSLSFLLNEAQKRNFIKWDLLGRKVWPNYYVGQSYENEVDILENWTLDRLKWIDDSLYCAIGIHNSQLYPNGTAKIPLKLGTKVYPNPFSSIFYYDFDLNSPGDISLALYDLKGTLVSTIVDEAYYPAGSHSINCQSPEIPGSIYVLILKIDGEIASVQKLVKL